MKRLVCAAIKVEGISEKYDDVYLGVRHSDCFRNIFKRVLLLEGEIDSPFRVAILRASEQGFVTNSNDFVDRKEGKIIAIEANQVLLDKTLHLDLYSENLY